MIRIRIRKMEKIKTIHVEPDDMITLTYFDENGQKHIVLEDKINKTITVNKAVVFDVEKGDFGEKIKQGIGGAFLEEEK